MAPSTGLTDVVEIVKKLGQKTPKDSIVKLLKTAKSILQNIEQEDSLSTADENLLRPFASIITQAKFIRHVDKDVRLLTASCIGEVFRLFAPDAPYQDDALKEILRLFNQTVFRGLANPESGQFSRCYETLDIAVKLHICSMFLDLEAEPLINESVDVLISAVGPNTSIDAKACIRHYIAQIINDSESINQIVLDRILECLVKREEEPHQYLFVKELLQDVEARLGDVIAGFINGLLLEGSSTDSDLSENLHDLIFELYSTVPKILYSVIPNIEIDLQVELLEKRKQAVQLAAKLFLCQSGRAIKEYRTLFTGCFLKRFLDVHKDIRLIMSTWARDFLQSCSQGGNEMASCRLEVLSYLTQRLQDPDECVRSEAASCILSLCSSMSSSSLLTKDTLEKTALRLWDKKFKVRHDTLLNIGKAIASSELPVEQNAILIQRVLECIDDKDLAKEAARILEEDVGASLESPIEVARLWITAFGLFEERHRNLFRNFLQGKMAIKKLLLKWIGLRMRSKNPGPEDESIRSSIEALLSNFAGDTVKRVMPKLFEHKDGRIFKLINEILESKGTPQKATVDDLMKRVGSKSDTASLLRHILRSASFEPFSLEFGNAGIELINKELELNKSISESSIVPKALDFLKLLTECLTPLFLDFLDEFTNLAQEDVSFIRSPALEISKTILQSTSSETVELDDAMEPVLRKAIRDGNSREAKNSMVVSSHNSKVFSRVLDELRDALLEKKMTAGHWRGLAELVKLDQDKATDLCPSVLDFGARFVESELNKIKSKGFGARSGGSGGSAAAEIVCAMKALVRFAETSGKESMENVIEILRAGLEKGGRVGISAGKRLVEISKHVDNEAMTCAYEQVLMLSENKDPSLRLQLVRKVAKELWKPEGPKRLPARWCVAFPLAIDDTVDEIVQCGLENVKRLAKTAGTKAIQYMLACMVSFYAHHPSYDEDLISEVFQPVLQKIYTELSRANISRNMLSNLFKSLAVCEDTRSPDKTQHIRELAEAAIETLNEIVAPSTERGSPCDIKIPSSLFKRRSSRPVFTPTSEDRTPEKNVERDGLGSRKDPKVTSKREAQLSLNVKNSNDGLGETSEDSASQSQQDYENERSTRKAQRNHSRKNAKSKSKGSATRENNQKKQRKLRQNESSGKRRSPRLRTVDDSTSADIEISTDKPVSIEHSPNRDGRIPMAPTTPQSMEKGVSEEAVTPSNQKQPKSRKRKSEDSFENQENKPPNRMSDKNDSVKSAKKTRSLRTAARAKVVYEEQEEDEREATPEKLTASKSPRVTRSSSRNESSQKASYSRLSPVQYNDGKVEKSLDFPKRTADVMPSDLDTEIDGMPVPVENARRRRRVYC